MLVMREKSNSGRTLLSTRSATAVGWCEAISRCRIAMTSVVTAFMRRSGAIDTASGCAHARLPAPSRPPIASTSLHHPAFMALPGLTSIGEDQALAEAPAHACGLLENAAGAIHHAYRVLVAHRLL